METSTGIGPGYDKTLDEPMLQFFSFGHLPEHLQSISAIFWNAACSLVALAPKNPERTAGLRKLLEAKDCAVRSLIYK